MKWYAEGLGADPDIVRLKTDEYVAEMDDVGRFLEECCDEGANYSESAAELHHAYTSWATKAQERVRPKNDFGARLGKRFGKHKSGKVWVYEGVRLKPDDIDTGGGEGDGGEWNI